MMNPFLYVATRGAWRAWLKKHHASEREVWLIYYKKHTDQPRIPYEVAVEEALCFGWIDSTVRRLDDERFAQRFTPRKDAGNWSAPNRRRMRALIAAGRVAAAGLAVYRPVGAARKAGAAQSAAGGAAPGRDGAALPPWLRTALHANRAAKENFDRLAPSYRRLYVAWISAAKKEETRARRLREALALLAQGKKLGMK